MRWAFYRGLRETLHPRLNALVRYAAARKVVSSTHPRLNAFVRFARMSCRVWYRGLREELRPRLNASVRYAAPFCFDLNSIVPSSNFPNRIIERSLT